MHNRIHALEETSRRHTALIQRLQQLPVQSLSAEQLQSLESTIAALRQDPERIFTLVALSGHVGALDDIIHNYLEICRVIQGCKTRPWIHQIEGRDALPAARHGG
jgi:hypothetical protein